MKTEMTIEFKNFEVPSMVTEDQSIPYASAPPPVGVIRPVRQYLLSELPASVLDDLCAQFRLNVFKKAGAAPMPTAYPPFVPPVAPAIPVTGDHGEKVVISYPGGQWVSPAFHPPVDGEVYQVYNGTRYIAEYIDGYWYKDDRILDNVTYYTAAAPIPGE